MLSNISTAERGFGAGACCPVSVPSGAAGHPGVVAFRRPRAPWSAEVFNPSITAAQVKALGQPYARNQHQQTTRFAAANSGGVGPHPARDPV
jgi:hypothetical protein